MIEIKEKKIYINGEPTIILSGEIHYFRLKREDWQDRIDKLKKAGCNAVASYIPWLCHEPIEGTVDLEGKTRPELDVGSFIDLCKENGLYFIARPGPFVMAELKNEGIPYWVYEKHPEIIPKTWDGKTVSTKTIDYLAPSFIEEVRHWYSYIMPLLANRLITNGGNIIGIQLDNEIGMLSWVSNSPDLTENVISDFTRWLKNKYSMDELKKRYPFDINNFDECINMIRTPQEDYALRLLRDLGHYMRNRFARYVDTLKSIAEDYGISGVPFIINIHGTIGGRGFTFPIGISQLYETYKGKPNILAGTDIYLGDITMTNFHDLYIINAFMEATNDEDKPLCSMEFECGDGNYGEMYSARYSTSAIDFKTRMCLAQGNRLLNFYLFAGGYNYLLDHKPNDGNNRIAITGERHGVAAPVNPEGELNYTYPRMAQTIKEIMLIKETIAISKEERNNIAVAFIPDYFMTEYYYPNSKRMVEFIKNLETNRAYAWDTILKAILLTNFSFTAIDIQNNEINKNLGALIVTSARFMDKEIQSKLVNYVKEGGDIVLYGEVPLYDMEGNNCTILLDAMELKFTGYKFTESNYYLTISADDWMLPKADICSDFAQTFDKNTDGAILRIYDTKEVCGFEKSIGKGKIIAITARYKCDISFFKKIFERIGIKPKYSHDCDYGGIFMTSTISEKGHRLLYLINLDDFEKEFYVYENETKLLPYKIFLGPKQALTLSI